MRKTGQMGGGQSYGGKKVPNPQGRIEKKVVLLTMPET
jgi:hypothetical protein